ncbi:MAG: hypothetical protein ACOCP8_10125, partial [archaeon]
INKKLGGYTFDLKNQSKEWLTKTLTSLFRNDKKLLERVSKYQYALDVNLFYHLLKKGKGFYFTKIMGFYRIHEGGINSMEEEKNKYLSAYNVYKELYLNNKDKFTRLRYIRASMKLFNYYTYTGYREVNMKERWLYLFRVIPIIRTFDDLKMLLYLLFPANKLFR